MGYVDDNLMPGERVNYRAQLHWIIYARPFIIGIAGVLFIGLGVSNGDLSFVLGLGIGLLVFAGLMALSRIIVSKTSEFAVTNKRVIIKIGVIKRNTLELLLNKVESIKVDQGIAGRILGYGTIVVIGTGGTNEPFMGIAHPLEFRKRVQALAVA
jgi:uncharacterized membrane protein YdbT with pleckstrin-like domain